MRKPALRSSTQHLGPANRPIGSSLKSRPCGMMALFSRTTIFTATCALWESKIPVANGIKCTINQVKAAVIAVRTGQLNEENRSLDFKMRPEQESGGREDRRIFQEFPKGEPKQATTLPLERQDAVRQDLCRVPTGIEDGLAQNSGIDLQASGPDSVGRGSEVPRRLPGLAIHHARRLFVPGSRQEKTFRLLRIVSGLPGPEH